MTKLLFCCSALIACAAIADDNGLWRPTPPKREHPYPRPVPREPRTPARLTSMTIDGTFETYSPGASVNSVRDAKGRGTFFGAGTFQRQGADNGTCILVPGGNGPTIGFEEKNVPFKPNTWYRIEYMMKGIPFMMTFSYAREAPTDDNLDDYQNKIFMGNSFGGGYGFVYVCAECDFVKTGTEADGSWITFGFNELPDTCPECGAKNSLYNEGGRKGYKDWTLVYADFKTGDYVGYFHNVPYYWLLVIIGSGADNRFDNLMVYEITGEGGEAVGNDLVVDIASDTPLAPPRVSQLEIFFGNGTDSGVKREATAEFQKARRVVAAEKGILIPPVRILRRADLEAGTIAVHINGKTAWQGAGDATTLGAKLADALRANAHNLLTLDDTALLAPDVPQEELPKIHAALKATLAEGKSINEHPMFNREDTTGK